MEIIICSNEGEFASVPARMIAETLERDPGAMLVLPTGNSPLPMFNELVNCYQAGKVDFSAASLVELDDYYGIALDDRRNLFAWLDRVFISRVNFDPQRVLRFNTQASDTASECARLSEFVKTQGGIDLLVLGLGPNGHIGFNEPGTPFSAGTRIVDLTAESVTSNARYWGGIDQVPRQGYTLGMDLICQAKKTILLVNGKHKAIILRELIEGPITETLPATCLRTMQNVTIIADRSAAALLTHKR